MTKTYWFTLRKVGITANNKTQAYRILENDFAKNPKLYVVKVGEDKAYNPAHSQHKASECDLIVKA
jgi:hypothetical protein